MTNSNPKQLTILELFKKFTPRQNRAISNVVHARDLSVPDSMYWRINGNIQSILTFEVNELASLEGHGDDEIERSVDGYFGVWHARVSTHPVSVLDDWDALTTAKAEGIITRLLSRAGLDEDAEVHPGSDGKSIHVHKWATIAEIKIAGDRLDGLRFSDLTPSEKETGQ